MTDTSSCASYAPESRALSAEEARDTMVAEVVPIAGHEFVPLRSALGRILAADIVAPHDVPAHDNSAMAVSYTHLDVYKRQASRRWPGPSPGTSRPRPPRARRRR